MCSAKDDVIAFKDDVEKEDCDVDEIDLRYGRNIGNRPSELIVYFNPKNMTLQSLLDDGYGDVSHCCIKKPDFHVGKQ